MASRRDDALKWRRGRIVEAAASVFVRRGYHGATMDDIAREAEYSTPALYNYFKNKEEIFRAVVMETGREFVALMDQPAPPELPFDRRLAYILRRLFALAETKRDLFVAFVAQRGFCDLEAEDLGDDSTRHNAEALAAFEHEMARGLDEGALASGESAADYATAFVSITKAFMFRWLMSGGHDGLEQQADRIVRLFMNGAAAR